MGGRVSIATHAFFDLVHLSRHVGLPWKIGTSQLAPAKKHVYNLHPPPLQDFRMNISEIS